jgi:hypothetical protein
MQAPRFSDEPRFEEGLPPRGYSLKKKAGNMSAALTNGTAL